MEGGEANYLDLDMVKLILHSLSRYKLNGAMNSTYLDNNFWWRNTDTT